MEGYTMRTLTGVNGSLELLGDRVVLKRGKLLGNFEKTTFLQDIVEVEIKKPGLARGLFSISTALDRGNINSSSVQANNIALKSGQWDEAVEFKRALEEAMNLAKSTSGAASSSSADELAKYKALLDSGAISETEYEAKKKQLLGL